MCNPRRVRVEATREVVEAWHLELERRATASDSVVSELEVSHPFGGTLGPRTREVFERALGTADGWRAEGGVHVRDLPDGQVRYEPATGELVVTARLEDVVTAEGHAAESLRGDVRDRATGRGEGRYYNDGFGGRNRETAERDAQAAAEADAVRRARDLAARLRSRADQEAASAAAAAEERLQRAADADARARLAEERERVRAELDARNRARITRLGEDGLRAVNGVLATAYRRALVDFARQHGASGIRQEETEDGIDIEFELEM
ncbi:hypothetical protein AB0L35_15735 [Streptomyces sp. NPDC052309]|uniref:FtsH ternary system domain-containing protein n=1 Tax=Streptomyces griseicoloratus TaxID=2752516 RepID=A0A926L5J9_9ACTN|nr:hypothetical protein [Streptomyces griseicoloratus]MBD0421489.1 hypothetical protein [Streptomyces griseicoloratus]